MHVIRISGPYYESFLKFIDKKFLYDVVFVSLFIVFHLVEIQSFCGSFLHR